PGQEDFESLWDLRTYGKTTKEGGYVGNEGSTRVSTYTRYAIVAWSTAKHPENALKYMPVDAAVEALHCRKPVSAEELGQFLNGASAKIEAENKVKEYGEEREVFSMKFFRLVCELLAETGDPKVVNSFFTSYCGALSGVEGNETFIPSITTIVRTFDWSEIGDALLKALGSGVEKDEDEDKDDGEKNNGLSPLEMTLRVVDGLDSGTAQQALVEKAVEIAAQMADKELFTSNSIGLLWKWVIHSDDKNLFGTIAKKFRVAETSLLGPSIQYVWQYLSNNGNEEKRAVLDSVVPLRVKWLEDQIEAMDKTFSWEMLDADFSHNEKIQAFLRGPEQSMTTKGVKTFKSFQEAKNYAAKYMPKERDDCSFEMEAAEVDGNAFRDNQVMTIEEKLVALRRDNVLREIKPSEGQEGEVAGYLAVTFDVQWTERDVEVDDDVEIVEEDLAAGVSLSDWTEIVDSEGTGGKFEVESKMIEKEEHGSKKRRREMVENRDFQRIQKLLEKGKALQQSMERAVTAEEDSNAEVAVDEDPALTNVAVDEPMKGALLFESDAHFVGSSRHWDTVLTDDARLANSPKSKPSAENESGSEFLLLEQLLMAVYSLIIHYIKVYSEKYSRGYSPE
ncbi:hypothetical protein JG688_00014037, partial [Phytophthora aleatoria]